MGLLLKCEHVGFGYENQDAVLDVNLEVNEGDYICIVGENGSGKSTLMKGILGLLKPTSGRIEYSEELKKAGIGYLPQQTDAQKVSLVSVLRNTKQHVTTVSTASTNLSTHFSKTITSHITFMLYCF